MRRFGRPGDRFSERGFQTFGGDDRYDLHAPIDPVEGMRGIAQFAGALPIQVSLDLSI